MTPDAEHEAWLRRLFAHMGPAEADLGGMRPHDLLTGFDRLPRPYRADLLRQAARTCGWQGTRPTRDDLVAGARYIPSGGRYDSERYRHHLACRPLAEAVAARLEQVLRHADSALFAGTNGQPDHTFAARVAAAARDAAQREEREERARVLAVVARAVGRLDAVSWTEGHIRAAAELAASLARSDAQATQEAGVAELADVLHRFRRGSVYAPMLQPVIPAVPVRDGDEEGPDLEAVRIAEAARNAAIAARTHAMRADDAARLAWRSWDASVRAGAPKAERHRLLTAYRARQYEAEQADIDAVIAEADERAARVECWGTPEAVRACSAGSRRAALRAAIGETDAHLAAILGLVGGPRGERRPAQVTEYAMDRARQQAALNRTQLEDTRFVLRNERGNPLFGDDGMPIVVNAAEMADAKAKARRSRAYAMCLGMQEVGQRRGWDLLLLTTTLPPVWHPNPSRGRPALRSGARPHRSPR